MNNYTGYYVCGIYFCQLFPVHPGHMSRADALKLVDQNIASGHWKSRRVVVIRKDVYEAYQQQVLDEIAEDREFDV